MKVTNDSLADLANRVNELTNTDNHKIYSSNGGYQLVQQNDGYVSDVLYTGFISKKELYAVIMAYIKGLQFKK